MASPAGGGGGAPGAGDATLEARYAWLAGNWRAAAAAGDVDKRVLAAWMAGEGDLPEELKAAVEADPALAGRVGSFLAPADAAASADPAAGADSITHAREALDAAQKRREQMRSLLTDG
jgi:hypothetical protein